MQLKSKLHWIEYPGSYWISQHPEYPTFIQVYNIHQNFIYQLGKKTITVIANKYELTLQDIQQLLPKLGAT